MGFRTVRRAASAAVALTLAASGLALADTTPADADALTLGIQGSLHLGDLAPGAAVDLQVGITLRCANGVHAERGSTIAVELESATYSPSGSAVVTSGSIGPVPGDWPLDGESCPSTGVPSLPAAVPVSIAFTAPAAPGAYEYAFTFARTPDTGISGVSGVAFTFQVVEPDPDPADVGVAWNAPLGGGTSVLTARLGRTVPVKVSVTVDGLAVEPGAGPAPVLELAPLASCGGAPAGAALTVVLAWQDGTWTHRLDTRTLSPGCWSLTVMLDGTSAGSTGIRVVGAGGAPGGTAGRRSDR
jgi:hypothetical protein